jgi:hypothetical protein
LLRLLFIWQRQVPTDAASERLLRVVTVAMTLGVCIAPMTPNHTFERELRGGGGQRSSSPGGGSDPGTLVTLVSGHMGDTAA